MSGSRILIVEDDRELMGLLQRQLEKMGYQVDAVDDGALGLEHGLRGEYALVILDCDLPGLDGLSVCRKLRSEIPAQPILMLTGKSKEIEVVEGLQTGADDYVTKPFGLAELTARIEAVLRRSRVRKPAAEPNEILVRGPLELDGGARRVFLSGEEIDLTKLEFDLLYLLAANPGKSFTRAQLLDRVWDTEVEGYDSAVNSLVLRLRKKLETSVTNPRFIKAVRGVGYRFSALDELDDIEGS